MVDDELMEYFRISLNKLSCVYYILSYLYLYSLYTDDDNHEYFLDSEQGQAYVQPFKALRLNHIFMDLGSINMIEQDHLIPHG